MLLVVGGGTVAVMRARIALAVAAALTLSACTPTEDGPDGAASPAAETSAAPTATATTAVDEVEKEDEARTLYYSASCSSGGSDVDFVVGEVDADSGKPAKFKDIWSKKYDDCTMDFDYAPSTALEEKALDVAKYEDADVSTLYSICFEADPGDLYAAKDSVLNKAQKAELRGAMMLCPDHPLTKRWKATLTREEPEPPTYAEMYPQAVENCAEFMVDQGIVTRTESGRQQCEVAMDPDDEDTHWMIDQYYTTSPDDL